MGNRNINTKEIRIKTQHSSDKPINLIELNKNSNFSSMNNVNNTKLNTNRELPQINKSFNFSNSEINNHINLKTQSNVDQSKRSINRRIMFSPTTEKRISTEYVHVHEARDSGHNLKQNHRSIFSASTIDSEVPNVTIKDECISCTVNKEHIMHAYKLACLNYKSSNIIIDGKQMNRRDVLDQMASILDEIAHRMSARK